MNGKMKTQNRKKSPPLPRCQGVKELHNRGFKEKRRLESERSRPRNIAKANAKLPKKSIWGKRLMESAAAMLLATGLSACESTVELKGDATSRDTSMEVETRDTTSEPRRDIPEVIEDTGVEGILDVVEEPCEVQVVEETQSISLHQGESIEVGGLEWRLDDIEVHDDVVAAIISITDPCTGDILKRDKLNEGTVKEFNFGADSVGADAMAAVETTRIVPGYTEDSRIWEATITMSLTE